VKLGLPFLDRLGLMRKPARGEAESWERVEKRAAIYEKYPELNGEEARPLTIVYAPTFRDGAAVDAEGLVRAFTKAMTERGGSAGVPAVARSGLALVLKLHPLDTGAFGDCTAGYDSLSSGGRIASAGYDALPSGGGIASAQTLAEDPAPRNDNGGINPVGIFVDRVFPLIDWYAAADVIITDYSGVAVEAAAAGFASYYYIYDVDEYKERRGLNVDLREEAVGKYAFTDGEALAAQVLGDFTRGENSGAGRLREYSANSNLPENGGAGFAQCSYDYEALAAFAGKYLEVPLSGNTRKLTDFIVKSL